MTIDLPARRARYIEKMRRGPAAAHTLPAMPMALPMTTSLSRLRPDGHDPNVPSAHAGRTVSQQRTALRELQAHATFLGVQDSELAPAIQQAELARGTAVDPRVDASDMQRAVDRATRAASLEPVRQNVLFGFTRVVDAKLVLSPALLGALADDVGARHADQLLQAIDHGPGGGALVWPRPQGKVELVASLVRQLVKGGGASLQLAITPEQAAWLEQVARSDGARISRAMGGAGAFCANLASAFDPLRPRFFSREPLPRDIADRFASRVEIVDHEGESALARKRAVDEPARVNYSAEYNGGDNLAILGRNAVKIDGVMTALRTSGAGRVILGTKAKDVAPGFDGVDVRALRKMAVDNDVFFFVGSHYLTQSAPADAAAQAQSLASSLDVMKSANPAMVRHLQYVVPKVAGNEASVLGALAGHVESMSLNAVEVPALVHRLYEAGCAPHDVDPNMPRSDAEKPTALLDGALSLAQAMQLQRVHLHGLEGDLVILSGHEPGSVDVDRTRAALLRARQLASMKAGNDTGEIKSREDLFDLVPVVRGTALAAVEAFADEIARRYLLSPQQRDVVAREWCYTDPTTERTIFFVPSRGINDRTGGTVSLGDTIDATALLFARTDARPKEHPRLVR